MMDDVQKIALIEEYLKGNLTGKTLEGFEAELANDSALAKEVAIQKEIYSGIERAGDKSLKVQLDGFHEEFERSNPKFSKGKKKAFFYTVGGLTLVLLSIYTFTQMGHDHPSDEIDSTTKNEVIVSNENNTDVEKITNDSTISVTESDSSDTIITNKTGDNTVEAVQPIIEVKTFTNPIVLGKTTEKVEYIFTFGELKLFGAAGIDINRLEIIRHNNDILLFDQKQYYVLEESHKRKALIADPNIRIFETFRLPGAQSPKMKIVKSNIELKEEIEFTSIKVIKKSGLSGRKYRFSGVTIEFTEDLHEFFGSKFEIVHIDKIDQNVFKTRHGLFHLEKNTKDFVEIIKVHDPDVQHFFDTEERLVPLKSETVEGGELGKGRHPSY